MRRGRPPPEGVEVTGTFAPDDLILGAEVLHRETEMIKIARNKIINAEFIETSLCR
jgi:hypothetical protein